MNCSDCKNNGTQICSLCCSYHGIPDRWEVKPRTNADRIRAMSDEELARWIHQTRHNPLEDRNYWEWLEWLKQEAKE